MRAVAAATLLLACAPAGEEAGAPPLAGGETTVADQTSGAYSNPAPNLDDAALARHLDGDREFEAVFVSPPADVNPGLGPTYNHRACSLCHLEDGRGLPVARTGGSLLVVQVATAEAGEPSAPGGPVPDPVLGLQVHDQAIYGAVAPVSVALSFREKEGAFPSDGEPYALRTVVAEVRLADGSEPSFAVALSPRIPPPVFGLGLLEAVDEATLVAMADPEDEDGDGISGRLNQVWSATRQETVVGRFGWKAGQATLLDQAAADYLRSMGVGTEPSPHPDDGVELATERLEDVAFYTASLAVPMRRDWDDAGVLAGEARFVGAGCATCHVPTLVTGDHDLAAVAHQTIHPYTDLLLHDMGMELADGREEFEAAGTEWRTAPLWGIGLTDTVLGDRAFLHDGRARTLEEAILWHAGEGAASRDAFLAMDAAGRAELIAFLESL